MFEKFAQDLIAAANAQHRSVSKDICEDQSARVVQIDHHTVVLGMLRAPPEATALREAIMAQVDDYLDEVLRLRKSYSATKASDLYLMLAAPMGKEADVAWQALAAEIERDDRLARKHVWLPDAEGGNFTQFLEETFLACPWQSEAGQDDALDLLSAEVAMPDGWKQALLDPELEGIKLVEALLALETQQEQQEQQNMQEPAP